MIETLLKKLGRVIYKKQTKNGYRIYRVFGIRVRKRRCRQSPFDVIGAAARNPHQNGPLAMPSPAAYKVGKWTYCGPDLVIDNEKTVIGAFCSIGCRVVIGHGEHPTHFLSSNPYLYLDGLKWKSDKTPVHNEYCIFDPIVIGNDVWIGDGAFIKNGVHIGDGAVIGARSLVTKDVPPYAIVAGIPAKVIRYRFSPEIIERLQASQWWNLDDEVIREIPYDSIESALEYIERRAR